MKTQRVRMFAAASLVAMVGLTACEYREVDGVGTRTFDEEFAPQDDVTAFNGCSQNGMGQWQVDGEVTNHTAEIATYVVTVAFADGDQRIDERSMWVRDLHPGERANLNRGWWINQSDQVTTCTILTIDRFTTPIAG